MAGRTRTTERVAAVIVVWRSLGTTLDAIASLRASSVPLRPLVCVAQQLDASELELLAAALGGEELIVLDENIGFAAAVNIGVSRADAGGCDWVLLANNDAVIAPSCIDRCLAEAAANERVGVVSPAIAYSGRPNRLWFAGAAQSHALLLVWHRGHFAKAQRPPPSRDCDYIPSCTALMSIDAWREVGPMRDDFFMYFEDVEWGERARALGWHLRYVGEVLSHHEMGGSSDHGGSRYMAENTAYYMARNPLRYAIETPTAGLRLSRVFGVVVIWTLYNLTRVRPLEWSTAGRAIVQGLVDGWAGRMGRRDLARPSGVRRARGSSSNGSS